MTNSDYVVVNANQIAVVLYRLGFYFTYNNDTPFTQYDERARRTSLASWLGECLRFQTCLIMQAFRKLVKANVQTKYEAVRDFAKKNSATFISSYQSAATSGIVKRF